jgi:hypothetical protein
MGNFFHFESTWKPTHYSVNLFKLKLYINAYDWESITKYKENTKRTSI